MGRLIVNADDLGLTEGVNVGIFEAHTRGIVTSASLMVDGPAAASAVRAAGTHPQLSVGLHFVEDRGAVLDDSGSLRRAFKRQLDRFRQLVGRDPTHVDSHHHVHLSRLSAFEPLVRALGVPLRGDGHVRYIGGFFAERGDLSLVSREQLLLLLRAQAGAGPLELGCHPGRVTQQLASSYRWPREVELATLTSPGLGQELKRAGLELVGFAEARPRSRA